MAYTQGTPDGSHLQIAPYDDRFQMITMDGASRIPVALPWAGTKNGSGAAGLNPREIESGVFLSLGAQATGAGTGYGTTNPFNTGLSLTHGTKFHDYAADADDIKLCMVFAPNGAASFGMQNQKFGRNADGTLATGPVILDSYDPGAFNTEACTGLRGTFTCTYPVYLLSDMTVTGYTPGADITVSNGRAVKAASGDTIVGKVIEASATFVRIEFNIQAVMPKKA